MKVSNAFLIHEMPNGAVAVRCHVLDIDQSKSLEDFLVKELPWCYTTQNHAKNRTIDMQISASEFIATKFPDQGSVMSGDFGEVLTLFFLSSENQKRTIQIKKWRYKEDRLKAAPLTDVIMFHQKDAKNPSSEDFVICAEVKQKATKSNTFFPIEKSIEGFNKDKTGRLARTLAWLREKAIDQESPRNLQLINRFTLEHLNVAYKKHFKSVAIVDRNLLHEELVRELELPPQNDDFEVIVLGIDNLKSLYEKVFCRATAEVTIE